MINKGKQMIPFLNQLNLDVSALGNHDLDFGCERFLKLSEMCNFTWINSNLKDKKTLSPFVKTKNHKIIEKNGFKIAFISLVDEEFLQTLVGIVNPSRFLFF